MNLTTRYLGLDLPSPIVASASPLNARLDNLKALQDCGAGAVVLPSVFEEQIAREQEILDALIDRGAESFGEALNYFPTQTTQGFDTSRQLDLIERAARTLDIPVIASLNGVTDSGWVDYARDFQNAGARAIELNIFLIPSDPSVSGAEIERRYLDIVSAVTDVVEIPVAVKVAPYFSSPGHMAGALIEAGARGLVLFNRFYQPGVDSARDVVKYILAGADVVMTTSAILRHGIGHMRVLVDGLADWLASRGLDSVSAIRGVLSHGRLENPEAYERANYIRILQEHAVGGHA